MKRILSLILILIMMLTVNCYALDQIVGGANSFLTSPSIMGSDGELELAKIVRNLTNIGLIIGTIVAVAAGIIIGIKFMTDGANGSANLKQALTPYVIGVAILFGAYGIWAIIINLFMEVF